MKAEDVIQLLRKLGCDRIREKSNGWVTSSCPFARWTHGAGVDSSPSFGIHAQDGRSGYRCLACGQAGALAMLPFALQARGSTNAKAVADFIRTRDVATLGEIQERAKRAVYTRPPKVAAGVGPSVPLTELLGDLDVPVLSEGDLGHFMKLPEEVLAMPVLAKRRITPRTYEDWQIRWHPWVGRIAIPTRDHRKRLVGIAGRLGDDVHCFRCDAAFVVVMEENFERPDLPPKKRHVCPTCGHRRPPKYLHTKGFSRDNFLFGEHRIRKGQPGILVEGQFDAIAINQWGYNVAGVMGTWLSAEQTAKVAAWFTEVTILHETDLAGVTMAGRVRDTLVHHVPVKVRALPEGRDADELLREEAADILGPPPPP